MWTGLQRVRIIILIVQYTVEIRVAKTLSLEFADYTKFLGAVSTSASLTVNKSISGGQVELIVAGSCLLASDFRGRQTCWPKSPSFLCFLQDANQRSEKIAQSSSRSDVCYFCTKIGENFCKPNRVVLSNSDNCLRCCWLTWVDLYRDVCNLFSHGGGKKVADNVRPELEFY